MEFVPWLDDVNVPRLLSFEASAFYVMDRGYVDFARLYALHQGGAFFVARAKSPMDARRVDALAFSVVPPDERSCTEGWRGTEPS